MPSYNQGNRPNTKTHTIGGGKPIANTKTPPVFRLAVGMCVGILCTSGYGVYVGAVTTAGSVKFRVYDNTENVEAYPSHNEDYLATFDELFEYLDNDKASALWEKTRAELETAPAASGAAKKP